MRRFLKSITCGLIFLALLGFAVNSFAVQTLPTAGFRGHLATDSSGNLTLTTNPVIINVKYLDGTLVQANNATESILGATISIAGAARASDPNPLDTIYPFTNATLEVKSSDGFVYISATLINLELIDVQDGFGTVAINPGLDATIPDTLNLVILSLATDATHPSRYITEWQTALGASTMAGMSVTAQLLSGNPSGASDADIALGILDGTPPAPSAPPGTRSMGYWKTHEDVRLSYQGGADIADNRHLNVFPSTTELVLAVTKVGKKTMLMKAEQQLAALLLNIAQGLLESTPLTDAQKQNVLDPGVDTVGLAVDDISAVIKDPLSTSADLERVKDLAESINTDE